MNSATDHDDSLLLPIRLLLCTLLALLLQAPLQAADDFTWEIDLDSALKKAVETQKPLLIVMHTSTEPASLRMLNQVYRDAKVRSRMSDFVVLPTCMDQHAEEMKKVNGEERPVSILFGKVDCKTLMQNEREVRSRFFDSSTVKVPQHIVVDVQTGGEWRILHQKVYELSKSKLLDFLDKAVVSHGALRVKGLPDHLKKLFTAIRKGSDEERNDAVKSILRFKNNRISDLLFPAIQKLGKEKDRAECIRSMGYAEFTYAAGVAMRWLADKSSHITNCAVVTLEEMKAVEAMQPLLDLFPGTKEKELKKDILRALGPCGAGNGSAKKLLLEFVASKEEIFRMAAYLSLGHFLDDPEVANIMKERYKAERGKAVVKTALVWAFRHSRSVTLADELEELVAKERNAQIKIVAQAAARIMRGEYMEYDSQLRNALRSLYSRDKIVRNEIKEWGKEKGNSRGGARGGRGGRRR